MKYINADLIKELMKRSIALQGNCEYALWLQTVDNYVENLPSIDIDSRGHETMSDKVWCSKCRYLYRDFKYGLSCYRLMDNEPCKYEERKDEPQYDFGEYADRLWKIAYERGKREALEQTEPTISKMEQVEDEPQTDCYVSDLCKHYGDKQICGRCRSRNLFCEAEPQPRCPKCGKRGYIRSLESMGVKLKIFDEYRWKCTNCNKYFKEEPKDEPQTDCAWK